MKKHVRFPAGGLAVLLLVSGGVVPLGAMAQMPPMDISGLVQQNVTFYDLQTAQLQAMQQQLLAQQQQMLQAYIQANYGRLSEGYRQFVAAYGPVISFEQYAWNDCLTLGGTDVAGGLAIQRRTFEAQQRANATLKEGYDIKNRGWEQNQQQLGDVARRYDQEAVRGNQEYVNPQTGQAVELPAAGAEGAYRGPDGQTYYTDAEGRQYFVDSQGGFHLLQPAARNAAAGNPQDGADSGDAGDGE